jgi:VIT1/CCC1 family predicted Fe2+/Mn2+ transporter
MSIKTSPPVYLAHLTDVKVVGSMAIHRYSLNRVPIKRPADGYVACTITCGVCGRALECRVYSAKATRTRRLALIACAPLFSPILGALIYTCVILFGGNSTDALGYSLISSIISILLIFGFMISCFQFEHGVTSAGRVRFPGVLGIGPHVVRRG